MDLIKAHKRTVAPAACNDPILNVPGGVPDPPYSWRTVDDVLDNDNFCRVQTDVQKKIDKIKGKLKSNLGLGNNDFIDIPVLFRQVNPGKYIAYTANSVNMLVVTKANGTANLCIPKPYGLEVAGICQFERDITVKLQADYPGGGPNVGCIEFIDDFHTYHVADGEIHCGTNERRLPPADQWWWELDWLQMRLTYN